MRHTAVLSSLVRLVLVIGCAATVPAGAQWGANVDAAPWTRPEAEAAVRQLVGEQDYPLEFIGEYEHGIEWHEVLTRYRGRTGANGRQDSFAVDRERQLVTNAWLPSREGEGFYVVTPGGPPPKSVDPAVTEQLALELVTRQCPHLVEGLHRFARRTDGSPHTFQWQALDASGVWLPDKVVVGVDALTGQFCRWRQERYEVIVSLPPRLTEEQVASLVRQAMGWDPADLLHIHASVIGIGANQRVLWYALHETEEDHTMMCVDDGTGEIMLLR